MPIDTELEYYNKSKYYLLLCTFYNRYIHGNNNINLDNHFLVLERFDGPTKMSLYDLYDYSDYETDTESDNESEVNTYEKPQNIYIVAKVLNNLHKTYSNCNHIYIRNYKKIIKDGKFIKPEIAEYILLPSGEAVAILKTFWLRIIQRTWKRVYAQRQQIFKKRCCPGAISTFQLTGKWPQSCNNLPGLKSLLVR
jgi:hypothetical protein